MRVLGFILRLCLVLAVAAAVGFWTVNLMIAHNRNNTTPIYEIRLAAYMGGLFAGGSAATLVGVLMLLSGRRSTDGHER